MWHKEYEDYPRDRPLKKERVEAGSGIVGCEMHDLNGWGDTLHRPATQKRGFFRRWIAILFGDKKKKDTVHDGSES